MSVTLHTDVGDIKIEVFCERTPKTCENFLALCASNYYNGCVFHRNIKGFMVQTGDPTDRVSLCSPGCPGARFVDEAGLKLSSERSVCHCFLSVGTKDSVSLCVALSCPGCPGTCSVDQANFGITELHLLLHSVNQYWKRR
ncbi:peptidyl-prolyl cis-trans isomerase-like 3 isoform X5 [Arvicanthis niloticus]|uniref:peptidyl-prolyl cis-trans isomerase-like 3 isoform X5 n=1 Tax=Arvicanthis niloticus TaxID=61156 RepID=UPI00402B997E